MLELEKELKRLDAESEEDYQFRICGLKERYELTWEQISQILNAELGYNYTESKYRKQYNAYLKGFSDGQKEELGIDEQELRDRYISSTEKLPYYRLLRQDARFERFYRLVGENLQKLTPPSFNYCATQVDSDREYVLTIADLHFGANFEGVNNSYSMEIAQERLQFLFEKTVAFVIDKGISNLKILSLGDVVQGILRISDLRLNEGPVIDAFVQVCRILSGFLNALSKYCKVTFYQVCYSNHDQIRPLGTKASELATEDLGKILLAYLTDVLSLNKNVKIIGDPEHDYLKFKLFDFSCIALHGHQINNLNTLAKDIANQHREFFDYVFVGHSHSAKEFINAEGAHHNIETLVAPSFVGSCPYADKLMVGSKAASKIFEFSPVEGHIASYSIILN